MYHPLNYWFRWEEDFSLSQEHAHLAQFYEHFSCFCMKASHLDSRFKGGGGGGVLSGIIRYNFYAILLYY